MQDEDISSSLESYFDTNSFEDSIYNSSIAESIEKDISDIIKNSGIRFFEIKKRVKLEKPEKRLQGF